MAKKASSKTNAKTVAKGNKKSTAKPVVKKNPAKKTESVVKTKKVIPDNDLNLQVIELKRQNSVLQKNLLAMTEKDSINQSIHRQKDDEIMEKTNQLKDLSLQLENAKKSVGAITPEQRAEIEAEIVAALQQAVESETEKSKQDKGHFIADQTINRNGVLYTLMNNPGHKSGAFAEQQKNIYISLFTAQHIPTHVIELPEDVKQGGEIYLIYKANVTSQSSNVPLKA